MSDKPRIFLSYAKEDIQTVREIYHFLLENGCNPWIDEKELLPGQDWEREIEVAIEDADFFVSCLSNNSVDKRGYVQKELKKGLDVFQRIPEGKIFAIPIRLNECDVPRSLSKWHRLDWFIPGERTKLLAALGLKLESAIGSETVTIQPPRYENTSSPNWGISLKLDAEFALPEHPHRNHINVLKFSPDGKFLVGGLNQDRVAIWDIATKELNRMDSPKRSVQQANSGIDWAMYSIAISPDGMLLATPTYERVIQLWYFRGLEPYKLIETVNNAPISVAFSPDGEWLIAGLDNDGYIYSWSINDDFRRVDHVKAHDGRVEALKFHPNKLNFVTCSGDGNIRYWEIVDEGIREIRTFEGHDRKHVVDVAFSPDGLLLASGSVSGQIYFWNVETGQAVRELKHEQVVRRLAFSPDSSLLASGSNDRTLKIWKVADGSKLISKKFEYAVRTVDFSPDGQFLVVADEVSKKAQIWQVKIEDKRQLVQLQGSRVECRDAIHGVRA